LKRDQKKIIKVLLKWILPLLLMIEIFVDLTYQGWLAIPDNPKAGEFEDWRNFLSLQQIYIIREIEAADSLNDLEFEIVSSAAILKVIFKALVFFLISIQLQIFQSRSFERVEDYKQLVGLKSKAVI